MDLLVDLGNSRLKWALRDGDDWESAAAPLAGDLEDVLEPVWGEYRRPARVVVASVADPGTRSALAAWIAARWSLEPRFVTACAEQCGVRNSYLDPQALGPDRWAALVGAWALSENGACVADCGTAVTIDALTAEGLFAGGVIVPGIRLQRRVLAERTAGVRALDGNDASCLARTTGDAVAAGTVYGVAGAIDRVWREFEEALGEAMTLVITGGDADTVAPRLSRPCRSVPDLVLRGLARIADAP
jgi:type III pantothenate kinase